MSSNNSSRRASTASNRRPSGGLGSRLQMMTMSSLDDAKADEGMVAMEPVGNYRKGSASQRRESHGASVKPGMSRRASRASFTRCGAGVHSTAPGKAGRTLMESLLPCTSYTLSPRLLLVCCPSLRLSVVADPLS